MGDQRSGDTAHRATFIDEGNSNRTTGLLGGSSTSAMVDEMNFNPSVGTQTACPKLTDDNHELLDKMVLNMFKELNSY